ncbi:MAG TPA: hypothetical protein VGC76_02340 [Pyrinomonadaceae bacterium]|jgi:hypothetical protein
MSLKTGNPPEKALEVIAEAANKLVYSTHESALGALEGGTESAELAAPLEVYTLNLPDVIDKNLENSKSTGWRYTILRENEPVAAAEVNASNGEDVRFSHFNSGPFVEQLVRTLIRAENLEIVADEDYEARVLKIPALYVMALWLHGESDDFLIPMRPTSEKLDAGKSYLPEELFERLTSDARARLEFDDAPDGDENH